MLFCCSFLMGLMEKSCQKWSKLLCMSSCAFTQGEYSGCTNKIVAYYPALLTRMFACSFFLFKKIIFKLKGCCYETVEETQK